MLNIKEIALRIAESIDDGSGEQYFVDQDGWITEFAEALIAELAKQNEPVAWWNGKETAFFEHEVDGPVGEVRIPLYALPPTAEQIANETAEACAAYLTSGRYMALNPGVLISTEIHTQYIKNHDIYQANAIRRGAWNEFKKP